MASRRSSAKRSSRKASSRKSSPRRKSSRKSSARKSSGRKMNPYAKFVKAHYAQAKRSVGKNAKSTTVFKKIAVMYKKGKGGKAKKGKKH
jgi:hypothetical protein